MSEEPRNPIPRSLEEFQNETREKSDEERAKMISKIEKNNEKILEAAKVAAMMKSEGWALFWKEMQGFNELLSVSALFSITGGILEKGQAVERIQGRIEQMQLIENQIDYWMKKASEVPMDLQAAKNLPTN